MNSARLFFALLLVSLTACSAGGGGSTSGFGTGGSCANATQSPSPSLNLGSASSNIVPLYVAHPNTTGTVGYKNEPLVAVKICSPNHTDESQCQVIQNILLDTGSFGLRVFGSAIASNVVLEQKQITVLATSRDLAECTIFGTGATWGLVKGGDVVLGNQTATDIPIQIISTTNPSVPSSCAAFSPETDPCSSGFNGILGVGLFAEDCGADCNTTLGSVNPGNYFACTGDTCINRTCGGGNCDIPVPLNLQVLNPVAAFGAGFNNGVSITFPDISTAGGSAVAGNMTIGIGAAAGNVPGPSVQVFDAGPGDLANFRTEFTSDSNKIFGEDTNTNIAFIDTGSNGIFIDTALAQLPQCTSGFFCPSSPQSLSAIIKGYATGLPTLTIPFTLNNANSLFNTSNTAFKNVGGFFDGSFDWGLPFYFGKTVYHGINGADAEFNSVTKTGPYWAL